MTSPSNSDVQNLLPVQAYFAVDGTFQTFIGQGQPFTATVNPDQSGLHITNSTIDSSVIGGTTPAAANFTTATVANAPVSGTDVVNKNYLEYFAAGISWKQPVVCGTTANITLSGLQTIDGVTVVAGDRVLVKSQSAPAQNGIYLASVNAWSRAPDADTWNELISALVFIESGNTLAGSAWYCTIQPGGTIGTTAITWSNFSVAATYTAGTGLTLTDYVFSITNTGVTAAAYGSASKTLTATVNAQGQLTVLAATDIAISNTQVSGLGTMSTQNASSVAITGGTLNGVTIGGTTAGAITGTTITATTFNGAGTGLTGTASSLSIGGNAATATLATTATTATNIAGGAAGSIPYQTASGTTTLLAAGTNGYVLRLAAGVPAWSADYTGTVTSVSGTGTVSGISLSGTVTSSGNLTLGGSLDLSTPPAIGGTTPNTGNFTTLTTTSNAIISDNSANAALRITQVGSGNALLVEDSTNPDSTPVVIDTNGYMTIGNTARLPIAPGAASPLFQVQNNISSADYASAGVANWVLGTSGAGLQLSKSRSGTIGTYGIVSSGDALGRVQFNGDDGTAFISGARIQAEVDGTPATGSMPTRLIFSTTASGSSTVTERLRIASTGAFGLSGANYGTSGQVLTSSGSTSAPTWQTPVNYATVSDDTTTNATRYPLFAATTTGNLTTEYVSSTKLKYNPSTGALTASQLIIAP